MAVTVTTPSTSTSFVAGNLRCKTRDIVFDSSYPTGGEPLTASDLGLANVMTAIASVKAAGTGSVTSVYYDIPNAKLIAYTAAAEVADTTNLSAVTAQVIAFGK